MINEISQYSLKYRPRTWEEVYGQDNTVKALRERIVKKDYPTAVLFQGPFGCGKTSICEIFAAAMQASLPDGNPDWDNPACKSILSGAFDRDTVRLDGSQLSGKSDMVDFTRDLNMRPMMDSRKILLIEECDQISSAGMSSLLKILEGLKPWVTVCLLSMEDKVSGAIKSRCQVYQIKALGTKDIMMNLKHIMEQTGDWNNEAIPNDFRLQGLSTIASAAKGSMRQAVQFLEQCIINEAWTAEAIDNLIGTIDEVATYKILDGLLDRSNDDALWKKLIWMKTGDETNHFINYALMMLGEALIYKETGCSAGPDNVWVMKKLSASPNLEKLFYCLSLHPQLTKPFIRTSDILGALATYYQDIDFRPAAIQTVVESKTTQQIPLKVRRVDADGTESIIDHTVGPKRPNNIAVRGEVLEIGSKETPSYMKPKTNAEGVRVRQPKVDISNLEIAF